MIDVLYFSAPWCSPCKTFKPIVENSLKEYNDTFNLKIIDIEEENDMAIKYKIKAVPTVIFLKENLEIEKFSGSVSKYILMERLSLLTK